MGRPSVPLSQVVLKVHSRCDLACDHCYVYEAADQSWRGRPRGLSDELISLTAQRIAEHAASRRLPAVQVILHGGEPLLAGHTRLQRIITGLRSALHGVCDLDLRIHTNGVLLDEAFCELFAGHRVKVGISIDGDRAANDRHRRYADGRSSYGKVIQAIGLLREDRFRHLYAGLLCTIDVANDPLAVYQALMELRPPRIDFLLPHATWDHPPARPLATDAEYADWLIAIYDRWIAERRPVRIRTFDSILATLRGGESSTEALGLGPAGLVVIETDGSYEQVDSLKAAFAGAPETGMNVFDDALDDVAGHPDIMARQQGLAALSQTCQECPVVTSCGGGLYTHRYRAGTGFANPSVYCTDLLKLITYISGHQPAEPAGGPPAVTHVLSGKDFRALAAGLGGATAMAQLIEAERSLMRALLSEVYRASTAAPQVPAAVKAGVRGAWSVLTVLDREHPKALHAVLAHPYLRAWAVRCLEQLRSAAFWPAVQDEACSTPGLAAGLGHLGAIAVAGAIHARVSATARVTVTEGAVHLPTLGRLAIGPGEEVQPDEGAPGWATIDVTADEVAVRFGETRWTMATAGLLSGEADQVVPADDGRLADWQPVRRLMAPGLCVILEDTDPYRACHQWPASPRLSSGEVTRWQRLFRGAWHEIQQEHVAYAPALAAGLTTLVPLAAQDGDEAGGTVRRAFGAVAMVRPADFAAFARLLIQEFQYVKLGALFDLYELYEPACDRLFAVPWGEGKHQLERLWQEAYGGLAVTQFWRARHDIVTEREAGAVGHPFARTRDAIEILADSGALTPQGAWFVEEMRCSLHS